MAKEDLIAMLNAAQEISSLSLSADLELNDALKQGILLF